MTYRLDLIISYLLKRNPHPVDGSVLMLPVARIEGKEEIKDSEAVCSLTQMDLFNIIVSIVILKQGGLQDIY